MTRKIYQKVVEEKDARRRINTVKMSKKIERTKRKREDTNENNILFIIIACQALQ